MCISKVPLLSLFPMYRIHIRKRRMHRKKARGGEEAKKAPASFFFPILPVVKAAAAFFLFLNTKGQKVGTTNFFACFSLQGNDFTSRVFETA